MMGLQVMSQSRWNTAISIIGPHVDSLDTTSCQQVRDQIIARGDKLSWKASFGGFYLTGGHYSNNSSATLHDISTDKIAWFTHRTKRGNLAPLLAKLTLWSKSKVHKVWSNKNHNRTISQQLIRKMGKDCTKKMVIRPSRKRNYLQSSLPGLSELFFGAGVRQMAT